MENLEISPKYPLAETFERVWGQALLAVSNAEDEATRCAQRMADLAGWSQDEVVRQGRMLTDRLTGHRKDLEHNVEEGVRRALSGIVIPRRDQIQDIESRLLRLAARIDAMGKPK